MDREGDTGRQHQGRPGDLRRWTWSGATCSHCARAQTHQPSPRQLWRSARSPVGCCAGPRTSILASSSYSPTCAATARSPAQTRHPSPTVTRSQNSRQSPSRWQATACTFSKSADQGPV